MSKAKISWNLLKFSWQQFLYVDRASLNTDDAERQGPPTKKSGKKAKFSQENKLDSLKDAEIVISEIQHCDDLFSETARLKEIAWNVIDKVCTLCLKTPQTLNSVFTTVNNWKISDLMIRFISTLTIDPECGRTLQLSANCCQCIRNDANLFEDCTTSYDDFHNKCNWSWADLPNVC